MADLGAAAVGATAALTGVYLTQFVGEGYKRFRDGSAVAAGILGELRSYFENKVSTEDMLREWIAALDAQRRDEFVFRPITLSGHVYYESIKDKIGVLGVELVTDVIAIYAYLSAYEKGLDIIAHHYKEMDNRELQHRLSGLLEIIDLIGNRGDALFPRLEKRAKAVFIFNTL